MRLDYMKYLLIGSLMNFISVCVIHSQFIPHDKQLHITVGTEIGFATSVLTVEKKPIISFAYAVGGSAIIGTAKEIYDKKHGTPEVKDALATVAGGVIGWGIVQGFKWLCKKIDVWKLTRRLPQCY